MKTPASVAARMLVGMAPDRQAIPLIENSSPSTNGNEDRRPIRSKLRWHMRQADEVVQAAAGRKSPGQGTQISTH